MNKGHKVITLDYRIRPKDLLCVSDLLKCENRDWK